MGLFSNNSNATTIELYKQKAHLSNDYLQALSPLIERINESEGQRHAISSQLIQLIEDMKNSLSPDMFIMAVEFADRYVKHSEASTENYNELIRYYTVMGERTKLLVDEYGLKANGK